MQTHKKGGVAILMSDKIDLRYTEGYFIMIERSAHQEDLKT